MNARPRNVLLTKFDGLWFTINWIKRFTRMKKTKSLEILLKFEHLKSRDKNTGVCRTRITWQDPHPSHDLVYFHMYFFRMNFRMKFSDLILFAISARFNTNRNWTFSKKLNPSKIKKKCIGGSKRLLKP